MASLPPQRSSQNQQQSQQRRGSPISNHSNNNNNSNGELSRTEAEALETSTISVDSQTVLLRQSEPDSSQTTATNAASKPSPVSKQNNESNSQDVAASQTREQTPTSSEEPRTCWICFNDETEDPPDASPWRTPCPCALTAHEACLLDWIADLESPTARRTTSGSAELKCPQCKSEIKLARPRSYVVEAVRVVERYANRILLPTVVGGLGYTLLLGCSAHGAHSIRMIFGSQDADRILAPLERWEWSWFEHQAQRYLPFLAGPFFQGWRGLRVELGLPIIPVALIASRTTLADAVLPVLPIIFFATHSDSSRSLRMGYWPPSAALTLVILPYVRSAYDEYMERAWGARERAWLKEIQPDHGAASSANENDNEGANAAGDGGRAAGGLIQIGGNIAAGANDGDGNLEVGIEVQIVDETDQESDAESEAEAEAEHQAPQRAQAAPPLNAPPLPDNDAFPAPDPNQHQNQNNARVPNQDGEGLNNNNNAGAGAGARRQAQRIADTDLLPHLVRAADSVFGALLFPALSSITGEVLRLALPKSWTAIPTVSSGWRWSSGHAEPRGLLQTKWGRSIVGGCLLVVLKDAVRVYCRWRLAVAFRARRVVDYDKSKAKRSSGASNLGSLVA